MPTALASVMTRQIEMKIHITCTGKMGVFVISPALLIVG
jgi:hypothetical protein